MTAVKSEDMLRANDLPEPSGAGTSSITLVVRPEKDGLDSLNYRCGLSSSA